VFRCELPLNSFHEKAGMSQVGFSFSLFLPVDSLRSSRAACVAIFHPHSWLSWERIASRGRPAFSSHLVSSGNRTSGFGPVSTSPVTAVYRDLGMNVNADEKLNFRANWTIRGATLVQEIRPNVGEVNSKSGSQNCG